MKAISLWQPWATLIAIGAKRIETRSWETCYRGPIAIHAAKRWTRNQQELCKRFPFYHHLRKLLGESWKLPFGCIVATAYLESVVRIDNSSYPWYGCLQPHTLSEEERAFGNYADGRFAWILEDIQHINPPIPFRGSMGLFNIPDDICVHGGTHGPDDA